MFYFFQSVVLMFPYVEQDVNLARPSCSGLENEKIAEKNVKKEIGEKDVLQSGRNGLKKR